MVPHHSVVMFLAANKIEITKEKLKEIKEIADNVKDDVLFNNYDEDIHMFFNSKG